jgi:farnesol dehydrogenase
MKGCTHVFHLAAYAKNWSRDPGQFSKVNVTGMRNVFASAMANGVERVVLTSTIVTLGPTRRGVVGDENMPRLTRNYFTRYEETKTSAEKEALSLADKGFPVVIVNPTRVYGPGKLTEGNSVTQLIDRYDRGLFPFLLDRGVNVGNFVLVDDLVRGHILAMEKGTVGERYILGGENSSLREFFDIVDEVSGRGHLKINLPSKAALAYSGLQLLLAERFGIYPQITPEWVETFRQDWAFSSAKAEQELGYRITPLREGIRLTYEWLLKERKRRKRRGGKS